MVRGGAGGGAGAGGGEDPAIEAAGEGEGGEVVEAGGRTRGLRMRWERWYGREWREWCEAKLG